MKQEIRVNVDVTIRGESWMKLEDPEMSMEEAVEELQRLGNTVLAIDEEHRRVKCLDTSTHPEEIVYVCEKCNAYGRSEAKVQEHEDQCGGTGSG